MTAGGGAGGASGTSGAGGVDASAASTGGMGGAGGTSGAGGTGSTTCTGKPGKNRSKSSQMVMAAGVARTFVLYEPATLDANKPAPIVVVPHGFTMSGEEMFGLTGYDKIADREGLVVAYPDGEGATPWNVGSGICGLGGFVAATGDDQSFMNELIKLIEADQCVDHDHVFITGFSMGGYFSNETACMNPAFRAGGPHSGGTHDLSACAAKHKPMILFHFKSDSLIDYSCGQDARDQWVKHNGCTASAPDVTPVKGGSCEYYKDCPKDGQVAFCSFDEPAGGGGESITGHAWSGGSAASSSFAIPQTESASELGWAFFKKYAW
jgi:poly(3-hydroxybutyrate) depolymerase